MTTSKCWPEWIVSNWAVASFRFVSPSYCPRQHIMYHIIGIAYSRKQCSSRFSMIYVDTFFTLDVSGLIIYSDGLSCLTHRFVPFIPKARIWRHVTLDWQLWRKQREILGRFKASTCNRFYGYHGIIFQNFMDLEHWLIIIY